MSFNVGAEESKDINKFSKSRDYGISLLKVLMSFAVVCCHFGPENSMDFGTGLISFFRRLAVPCFTLISFFYFHDIAKTRNVEKFKKRLVRLLIPYVGWALLCSAIASVGNRILGLRPDGHLTLTDVALQLAFGHSSKINTVLYYLWEIMVISCIVFVMFYFLPYEKASYCMFLLALAAIVLQYSQINYKCFSQLPYEIAYTGGRFCELIPFACIGFAMNSEIIERHRGKIITISALLLLLVSLFGIFESINGFGYQGIQRIVQTVLLFVIANNLKIEKISGSLARFIAFLEKHILGIFCMHLTVGVVCNIALGRLGISIPAVPFCLLVWLIGLLASIIISMVPITIVRRLVS